MTSDLIQVFKHVQHTPPGTSARGGDPIRARLGAGPTDEYRLASFGGVEDELIGGDQ